MATRVSTGFAAGILGPTSFEQLLRYGCIEVYTGPQPANADLAATGTLIARITRDGGPWDPGSPTNGLEFVRSGRFALKPTSHDWTLKGEASGTAGWFRLRGNAIEDAGASVTAPRIDGAIGLEGTVGDIQLFLPTTTITPSTSIAVTNWWYAVPPIGE